MIISGVWVARKQTSSLLLQRAAFWSYTEMEGNFCGNRKDGRQSWSRRVSWGWFLVASGSEHGFFSLSIYPPLPGLTPAINGTNSLEPADLKSLVGIWLFSCRFGNTGQWFYNHYPRLAMKDSQVPCWQLFCVGIPLALSIFLPTYIRELSSSYPQTMKELQWLKSLLS